MGKLANILLPKREREEKLALQCVDVEAVCLQKMQETGRNENNSSKWPEWKHDVNAFHP